MANLTADHLVSISGSPKEWCVKVLPRALRAMREFDIRLRPQVAAFLATCSQETDGFATYEEYGDEAYFRSFLGDEWPYHGRGAIMLTWSTNYRSAGTFFGHDFIANPEQVEEPNMAWRVAGWFWRYGASQDINPVAASGNFEGVSSLVNRGELVPRGKINGWAERLAAYERAMKVLPHDLTVDDAEKEKPVPEYPTTWLKSPGWQTDDKGRYARVKTRTKVLVNKQGWQYAMPIESEPPVGTGDWLSRHPTRYTWRTDIEELVVQVLVRFPGVRINTYFDHPEDTRRDTTSFDVWGSGGRGSPVGAKVGQEVFDYLFNLPGSPYIDWCIWNGWQWWRYGNPQWRRFGDPADTLTDSLHVKHDHFTYL